MASIVTRSGGLREIRFYGVDEKRRTLRVGRKPVKFCEEVGKKIDHLVAMSIAGVTPDPEVTRWTAKQGDKFYEKLVKLGVVGERQTTKAERTNRSIATITKTDAKLWRAWLLTQGNQRDKECKTLSEETVRRRSGRAKQIFKEAVERELIAESPFEKLPSNVRSNKARQSFVDAATIQQVIEAAPSTDWRTIIALARFGGLRIPSELSTLRWNDIDLPRGRMIIHAPKTEHHKDGGIRICPIFPELRPFLEAAWDEAEDKAEFVIADPMKRRMRGNLGTSFRRIINLAKVKPWPKAFQNLRATRETELMAKYPAKDVASGLGNSEPVAMAHYAMAMQSSFDRAMIEGAVSVPAMVVSASEANPHQKAHHSEAVMSSQALSNGDDGNSHNTKDRENDVLCLVTLGSDNSISCPTWT